MVQAEQSLREAAAAGTSAFNQSLADCERLMWEVIRFLWSCPNQGHDNRYRFKNLGDVQRNVIEAIATQQYLIIRDDAGRMEHFMAYWMVREEDIEGILQGIIPAVRWRGDKFFVIEHGNKGGRHSLTRMIGEIKKVSAGNKGVFWHNNNRKTFKVFLNKKGSVKNVGSNLELAIEPR